MPSKIEEKDRIKIYKRVNLIEARTRFHQLPSELKKSNYFLDFPVSVNFGIRQSYARVSRVLDGSKTRLTFEHFEHVGGIKDMILNKNHQYLEVAGHSNSCQVSLFYILGNNCAFALLDKKGGSEIIKRETFLIGLNKPQYDLLFLSAFKKAEPNEKTKNKQENIEEEIKEIRKDKKQENNQKENKEEKIATKK